MKKPEEVEKLKLLESISSAYPVRSRWDSGSESFDLEERGLTKREMFAGLAMQGFAVSTESYPNPDDVAKRSVEMADALITELNKNT